MFAEWINDNSLLKATKKLNSGLKDLEVKLPIWLGKRQLLEGLGKPEWPAPLSVLSAEICFICIWVQSVLSSPLWWALSSHTLGQIVDYTGFRAGVGQWEEQGGLGSSSSFITISSNFSLPQNRVIVSSISQGYFRNRV